MESKRIAIDSLRQKLRERNADSDFSNQFLYKVLLEQAQWLIKREVSAGKVYRNISLFQPFVVDVIEVDSVDPCTGIKTGCKIYRTIDKLPSMWTDNDGPIISNINSIDRSTSFFVTNYKTWISKQNNPYYSTANVKYAFFFDGYIWFPKHNPNKVIIDGYFKDDINLVNRPCQECEDQKECVRFLDTKFRVPDSVVAEMYAKALEQIAGITKRLPGDEEINKNSTRR